MPNLFGSKDRSDNPAPGRAWACDKKFDALERMPNQDVGDVPFLAPVGIWNNGSELIFHPNAVFPNRCVYTNAVCGDSERKNVTWQLNAKMFRKAKRMRFAYSVSQSARWSRLTLLIAGLLTFSLGLGAFGLSLKFLMTQWPLFILIMSGIGLISFGVLIMWIAMDLIRFGPVFPAPYVAIFGCGREFMNTFPDSGELLTQLPKFVQDELKWHAGVALD